MLYPIGIIIGISAVGLLRILRTLKILDQREVFTKEYESKYSSFIDNKEFDDKEYQWLMHQVDKMQDELGRAGLINYQPPFQNYIMNDYHLLVNTLPQIREGTAPSLLVNGCQDVLIRHLGKLKEYKNEMNSYLNNPLRWFLEGVKYIISLPLQIAYMSGILGHQKYQRAYNGFIVSLLSFILSLVTFIAAIITILIGWDELIVIIKNMFIP